MNTDTLLIAAFGAVTGLVYAKSREDLDTISFVIGGTAAGFAVSGLMENEPTAQVGLPLSVVSLIAYDRWRDGMWPFTNEER